MSSLIHTIKNTIKKDFLTIVVGTLFFNIIVWYNGWPLITSDSGAYVSSGMGITVPVDRPIFYGIFLMIVSLRKVVWLVTLWQGFILSFLMVQFAHLALKMESQFQQILLVVLTSILTASSWYVGQLMPDIFTPILFLALLNFIISEEGHLKKSFLGIAFYAILTHHSHLIIAITFSVFLLAYGRLFKQWSLNLLDTKRIATIVVSAWFCICTANLIKGNGFTLSKVSHVFLMGKLCENGILNEYLKDNCDMEPSPLCDFRDKLPVHAYDYVWQENGVLKALGGWDSSKQFSNKILKQTITQPKYIKMHILESIEATYQQLLLYKIGDGLNLFPEGTYQHKVMQEHFDSGNSMFIQSKQSKNLLNLITFNNILLYAFILISTLGLLVAIIFYKRSYLSLLIITIGFVLCNAFVTATFANILPRLNSRAQWLIPMVCLLILIDVISQSLKKAKAVPII